MCTGRRATSSSERQACRGMGDAPGILREGARTALLVRDLRSGSEHRFEPLGAHARFLYLGSEVGLADMQGLPVVIVAFEPGHEMQGQMDWQYLVDVAHMRLHRRAPWR